MEYKVRNFRFPLTVETQSFASLFFDRISANHKRGLLIFSLKLRQSLAYEFHAEILA